MNYSSQYSGFLYGLMLHALDMLKSDPKLLALAPKNGLTKTHFKQAELDRLDIDPTLPEEKRNDLKILDEQLKLYN